MENSHHQQLEPESLPLKIIHGKDELNLAEFPLSSIADRTEPGQTVMEFEDKTWDSNKNEMITRRLTITASEKYGLPTAMDDEVILGLIQISKSKDFESRKVNFTRYQLIKLLGWRDESKSYERLEKSLKRWVGVTLYYKNAWWNREERSWVDEDFHILDNVTLYDKERTARRKGSIPEQEALPLSQFVWNDVIFRSFVAGNLKSLDFEFFKELEGPISKRLYRFLDKRFWHRSNWDFDLKEFSWEHIGLSRTYDASNLKRKLKPAIEELEQKGFLKPIPGEDRFKKMRAGEWRVFFEKAQAPPPYNEQNVQQSELEGLRIALLDRGVSLLAAQEILSRHPTPKIKEHLEVFDWLKEQKDPKLSKNPTGFLVASIRGEYAPPRQFKNREERERKAKEASERKAKEEEAKRQKQAKDEAFQKARQAAVNAYWDSLPDQEKAKIENDALARANPFDIEMLRKGGMSGTATRKNLLDSYILEILENTPPSKR